MAGTPTLARPRPRTSGRGERPPDPIPAGPEAGREGPDRRFWAVVALALVLGCALRVAIGATDDSPSTDETAYLAAGQALADGDGFARDGRPELHFPPLIPFLLGQGGRVFADPHTGAVVLTWAAGTALIVPLALLGRRVGGPRAGMATALVAAAAPGLATTPAARGAGSEAAYTLLVMTAAWWAVAAADRTGAARLLRAAGAGACLGLAYLARPEGLLLALPVGAALAWAVARPAARGRRLKAAWPVLGAFVAPILVCIAPYASYLHTHTGTWQLTAKTRDASIEAWAAVARDDREARDRVLYERVGDGWGFPEERSSLPSLALDDPAGYAGIVGTNVVALGRNLGGWWLLPLPVWIVAAVSGWRRRRVWPVPLVAAVALTPVVTSLAFFVQPRYLVVTTAAATVLVGAELAGLQPPWRRPVAAVTAALLVASSAGAFMGPGGWWHPVDHADQQAAGEWLADHTGRHDRVMTRSFVVEHYAGRTAVAMPYDDLAGILAFARHYGVRWLVVDHTSAARVRPQVLPLLDPDRAVPDGLVLAYESAPEGRATRVFRLDPAPPPAAAAGDPPTLGFMGDG